MKNGLNGATSGKVYEENKAEKDLHDSSSSIEKQEQDNYVRNKNKMVFYGVCSPVYRGCVKPLH